MVKSPTKCFKFHFLLDLKRISGVMVSVLTLSVVDGGFEPRLGQTKVIKLAFVASPLSTQH